MYLGLDWLPGSGIVEYSQMHYHKYINDSHMYLVAVQIDKEDHCSGEISLPIGVVFNCLALP
jgi:hypothetical protein